MFDPKRHFLGNVPVTVLGPYKSWTRHQAQGGDWDTFPPHSQRTLRLKRRKTPALDRFHAYLNEKIPADRFDAIATVPGHDPAHTQSGIRDLALRLAASRDFVDGTGCLIRHTFIEKLATGGSRQLAIHMNSMGVEHADVIEGRNVLLIDDVMTSGNSLLAGRIKLLAAGAASVALLALARTS